MKKVIVISGLLLGTFLLSTCYKAPIKPIKICIQNIEINLQDDILSGSINDIELSGEGLQYFDPAYGDQLFIDGTSVALKAQDKTARSIEITIPDRSEKKLSVGTVELKMDFPEGDSIYHCEETSIIKQFCYGAPIDIIEQSASAGDIITLSGQFADASSYHVFFFDGPSKQKSDNIVVEEGGGAMKVEVPARPFTAGNMLKQAITIDILDDQGATICTVTGPEFTYEYTYTATLIGGVIRSPSTQSVCLPDCGGSTPAFCHPRGIDVDQAGNVFVADSDNQVIWKIPFDESTQTYTTPMIFAGNCGEVENPICNEAIMNRHSSPLFAHFDFPNYLTIDNSSSSDESIYISEGLQGAHWLIRVIKGNTVGTFAGTCMDRSNPLKDGDPSQPKKKISFHNPQGMAVDPVGNVYVADFDLSAIYKINIADGMVDYVSQIYFPKGIYLGGTDSSPLLYVASHLKTINVIDLGNSNQVSSLGSGFKPDDITGDGAGILYVVNGESNTVLAIDGSNIPKQINIDAPLVFVNPQGIAYDKKRNRLFVADTDNHLVWSVDIY